MPEIVEYKKLNSFDELSVKDRTDIKVFLNNLKNKLQLETNYKNLNTDQKKILKKVKNDLFNQESKEKFKFSLSRHVIEEIKTLEDNKIPLYLVHRYRYETIQNKVCHHKAGIEGWYGCQY